MFKHSFDTTAGTAVFPHSLPGRLLVTKAEGVLTEVANFPGLLAAYEKTPNLNTVPIFLHPFTQVVQDAETTFIDLRMYRSSIKRDEGGNILLSNDGAVGVLMRRTVLEMAWSKGVIEPFFYNIDVPLTIFSRWLSGLMRSRFNLNEEVALKTQAIAAYYYYCLHCNKEDFDDRKLEVFSIKINRILKIPFQTLQEWFRPLGHLGSVDEFCQALQKYSGSLSLQRIDHRVIWTLTASSWFGSSDVKELLAVALEYPPAFISLVYSGINEKLYRKAFLSQLIEREGRHLKTAEFTARVDDIIRTTASV